MTLLLDPKIDVSEALKVTLGETEYLIPQLVLRQTAKIGPLLPIIIRLINRRAKAFEGVEAGSDGQLIMTSEQSANIITAMSLSAEETDAAIRIVCYGLSRAYPAATVDDLMDISITSDQLIAAMNTVVMQTHATKKQGALPSGEVQAAIQ